MAFLGVVSLTLANACRITEPVDFPSAAVEIAPPPQYARWWSLTESCAGRNVPFSSVRWFVAPRSALVFNGEQYAGYWFGDGNRIVLTPSAVQDGGTVRHEMLHAILHDGSHPRPYFVDRCGGIVDFGDPLHIEPSPILPGPAPSAPTLSPKDLLIAVELSPSQPTLGLPDSGWTTVIVSVTNPLPEPVWVRVHPFFPDQYASQTFGYVMEGSDHLRDRFEDYSIESLIPFAPYETKRRAFDFLLNRYQQGARSIRGYFSTDTAAAIVFTVSP